MFGFGLGFPRGASSTLESAILALFAGGQQGAWYDPSDYGPNGTLFTDSAGTTPVTSVEQPVGLMLDKSRGLVLGQELVVNGDFSNGTTGWTANSGSLSVVNGRLRVTNGTFARARQTLTTVANTWYKITFSAYVGTANPEVTLGTATDGTQYFDATTTVDLVQTRYFYATTTTTYLTVWVNSSSASAYAEFDNISVRELPGNHAYHTPGDTTTRPVVSRRINEFIGTETLATQNVTTRATNYSLRFSGTGSIALSGTATGTYSAGTHTITCTAGTLTATVSGSVTQAMLTPSDLAVLPYQRVTTTTDYDSDASKFPTFLRCDGVNDSLQTNAIDFSSTDKMFVGAAVRYLSLATTSVVAELSNSLSLNNGSFILYGENTGTASFASKGTSSSGFIQSPVLSTPLSLVQTGVGNISGDSAILRVNGAQAASSTADQGTGNYGNHKLYLFLRGGITFPLQGWFFGSLIKGATLSASQIALVERYLAGKTKTVVLA